MHEPTTGHMKKTYIDGELRVTKFVGGSFDRDERGAQSFGDECTYVQHVHDDLSDFFIFAFRFQDRFQALVTVLLFYVGVKGSRRRSVFIQNGRGRFRG